MTRWHLTFRGLVLQWFCIFADTTRGFQPLVARPLCFKRNGLFVYLLAIVCHIKYIGVKNYLWHIIYEYKTQNGKAENG